MPEWLQYLVLVLAGAVSGTLNVVAGGGSFLTLPILIFLGLPAGVANGTNRISILLQNAVASWSFDRYGVLDRRSIVWAAVPATAGAGLGTWAALLISDDAFKHVLATLMVVLSLWTLWGSQPKPAAVAAAREKPTAAHTAILAAGFFLSGVYGGFIQAGVGFLILAVTTYAGLDLVRGNAVKVLAILCLTTLSFAIFAASGKIHWPMGLALAAGTIGGGFLGAHLTVLKGHDWLRKVVTVTIIAFALLLWLD